MEEEKKDVFPIPIFVLMLIVAGIFDIISIIPLVGSAVIGLYRFIFHFMGLKSKLVDAATFIGVVSEAIPVWSAIPACIAYTILCFVAAKVEAYLPAQAQAMLQQIPGGSKVPAGPKGSPGASAIAAKTPPSASLSRLQPSAQRPTPQSTPRETTKQPVPSAAESLKRMDELRKEQAAASIKADAQDPIAKKHAESWESATQAQKQAKASRRAYLEEDKQLNPPPTV